MITTLESVIYSALFLLPGYITLSISDKMLPRKRVSGIDSFLAYLFCSLFDICIIAPIFMYAYNRGVIHSPFKLDLPSYLTYLFLFFIFIIIGASIGHFFGCFRTSEKIQKFLANNFKIYQSSYITAWHYLSSKTLTDFIQIKLINGDIILGEIGDKDYSATEIKDNDIYIKEIYKLSQNGKWEKEKNSEGIWLCFDKILTIEFLSEVENMDEKPNENMDEKQNENMRKNTLSKSIIKNIKTEDGTFLKKKKTKKNRAK